MIIEILEIQVFDLQQFARTPQDTESQLAGRRDIDYDEEITRYIASSAPITILTRKFAKKKTQDPEFRWFESDIAPAFDAINAAAGYVAGDTALVVDNPGYFTPYDVVKVPRTGEQMLVTAINDATFTLTVRRGFGTTAAAALVDNDPLFIVGNAHAEGSAKADMNLRNPVEKTNYCQIFKKTLGVTGTEKASKQKGEKEQSRLRLDKLIEHNRDIEHAFLFGEPKLYLTNEVRRTTGGVLYFANANVTDFGGATTYAEVETACEQLFAEGSDTKVLFGASTVLSVLDQIAGAKLQTVPEKDTWGLAVKRLVTSHGELLVTKERLLTGAVYGNYAVALDLKYLKYRTLRETRLETDIAKNGDDADIDQYLAEVGLEMKLPKCHAIWKNMTSAA